MNTACPACQSTSVHWLLHRVQGRGTHATQRAIHWGCRECGHEWSVPVEAPTAEIVEDPPTV